MDYEAVQARIDATRAAARFARLSRNAQARGERRAFVRKAKDVPCADCGRHYPYYVMEFDHLDSTVKDFGLGGAVSSGRTIQRLAAEIAKCEVVCSNCHRIRTHNRGGAWRSKRTTPTFAHETLW